MVTTLCICYRNVSAIERSAISATERCALQRGVRYREVCATERCALQRGVRYGEVCAIENCAL